MRAPQLRHLEGVADDRERRARDEVELGAAALGPLAAEPALVRVVGVFALGRRLGPLVLLLRVAVLVGRDLRVLARLVAPDGRLPRADSSRLEAKQVWYIYISWYRYICPSHEKHADTSTHTS